MYQDLGKEELQAEKTKIDLLYKEWMNKGLSLDMARGKPCPEQLSLSDEMNGLLSDGNFILSDGQDARNYGDFCGAPEARELFSELLEVPSNQILVSGSSSLTLMYLCLSHAMINGVLGGTPWCKEKKVKFLCPVPGYDRHFAMTESLGIEMVSIGMTEQGPDMDRIEKLVQEDESIKGIWLVPKYQNPTGIVFSDEVIHRLASLKPAAKDFRIYWDNAYFLHHLYEEIQIPNIITLCEEKGNSDLAIEFASFSKVTYASAGLSAMASSPKNMEAYVKAFSLAMVSPDKVNQLRHARFLKNAETTKNHMKKHAEILRPKFEVILQALNENLLPTGTATWTNPQGGYFISVDLLPGTAKRTYQLCKEAGLILTQVGATFPYGEDPENKNIRLAPSYPSVEDLEAAATLFTICARLAALEILLENKK